MHLHASLYPLCPEDWPLASPLLIIRLIQTKFIVCPDDSYLHYAGSLAITDSTRFYGLGTGYILLDNVNCIGTEERLEDCSAPTSINHGCSHQTDAAVRCQEKTGA